MILLGEKKVLTVFFSPTECSYKPSGRSRWEAAVSARQLVVLPRGIGSDLILPANVVRGPLHLPQNSSELLIGPSELIKR